MTRTGRTAIIAVGLALILVLACKSDGDPVKTAATQTASAASATAPAAKSPKEQALAQFLSAIKLEGKPVLIEFGLVGCELSEKGLNNMVSLQQTRAVAGLGFVRVEGNPDAAAVQAYFKNRNVPFPIYLDQGAVLAKALGATAFPTFVLVDKFGHIRYMGKYPEEIAKWGKTLVAEARDQGSGAPLFGAKLVDAQALLKNKLPDLDGKQTALGDHMGGGGIVLLFVDTTCPFSATALRDIPSVSQSLAPHKINAVIINNDDSREKVLASYRGNNLGTPVLYDTGAATREQWNVHSVPIAVYVTPAGKIGYQGEAVWANLGAAIETSSGLAAGTIKFTAAGTGFG